MISAISNVQKIKLVSMKNALKNVLYELVRNYY